MFKLHIYAKRTLNATPPFEGHPRRADGPGAVPETGRTASAVRGHAYRAIGGGAPNGPARRSSRS